MNKLLVAVATLTLSVMTFASAEIRLGASIGVTTFDADGTETLKSSAVKAKGSHSETVMVPALFAEIGSSDKGLYLGFNYTDAAALGQRSKVRGTDFLSDNDTGTNVADADVESLSSVYLLKTIGGSGFFAKLGIASADIITKEQLATGSTYGNVSVDGMVYGVGYQSNNDTGYFFRAAYEMTDYDGFTLKGATDADSVNNSIKAEVDSSAFKIAFGKSF